MNILQKIIYFIPLMVTFLRGHQLFIKNKFADANLKFEKCLMHPKFHHGLFFLMYGQSLCATGRLEEGHEYLLKACESFESDRWVFDDPFALDNASNCIKALKHTCHHLNIESGRQYFDEKLRIKAK